MLHCTDQLSIDDFVSVRKFVFFLNIISIIKFYQNHILNHMLFYEPLNQEKELDKQNVRSCLIGGQVFGSVKMNGKQDGCAVLF